MAPSCCGIRRHSASNRIQVGGRKVGIITFIELVVDELFTREWHVLTIDCDFGIVRKHGHSSLCALARIRKRVGTNCCKRGRAKLVAVGIQLRVCEISLCQTQTVVLTRKSCHLLSEKPFNSFFSTRLDIHPWRHKTHSPAAMATTGTPCRAGSILPPRAAHNCAHRPAATTHPAVGRA